MSLDEAELARLRARFERFGEESVRLPVLALLDEVQRMRGVQQLLFKANHLIAELSENGLADVLDERDELRQKLESAIERDMRCDGCCELTVKGTTRYCDACEAGVREEQDELAKLRAENATLNAETVRLSLFSGLAAARAKKASDKLFEAQRNTADVQSWADEVARERDRLAAELADAEKLIRDSDEGWQRNQARADRYEKALREIALDAHRGDLSCTDDMRARARAALVEGGE